RAYPAGVAANVQRPQRFLAFTAAFEAAAVERHLVRREDGRAHVNRDAVVILEARLDDAAHGFDADRALVGQFLFGHEAHEGARAVAALFDFAAVGVVDAVAEIDVRLLRL